MSTPTWRRRDALKAVAALGIGSAVFQRALAAQLEEGLTITPEMVQQAEWIAGLTLEEAQREELARSLAEVQQQLIALRAVELPMDVPPALHFEADPLALPTEQEEAEPIKPTPAAAAHKPKEADDLAFLSVTELGALLRSRQISSVELTKLYLERLHKYDDLLHCVVNFTEDLALRQAKEADRRIHAGDDLGPLHGIPWGAKDLIAYPGYPTTWGASPFRQQHLDDKATVAERLEKAGAVLVAKLTLGALAWGDQWFGGLTRNPWHPQEGSSGSSAGSAAAVAAGLVGFALGSETLGSIISPCRRCGATGLRPTFGRVSRHGCMPLAWSMDKIGPIARSVEDCALVLAAIHGADRKDSTAVDRPFHWPCRREVREFTVGYFEDQLDKDGTQREAVEVLRELGIKLVNIELPQQYPLNALTLILSVEAATVFDQYTRSGATEGFNRWPGVFRKAEFIPAVEYLRANRIRTLLKRAMERLMAPLDAYVGGDDLVITNLTGHPSVVLPHSLRQKEGVSRPASITFTGKLFGESELLALAHAYQQATDFHLQRPPLDRLDGSP